jgi:hypothetical protein
MRAGAIEDGEWNEGRHRVRRYNTRRGDEQQETGTRGPRDRSA